MEALSYGRADKCGRKRYVRVPETETLSGLKLCSLEVVALFKRKQTIFPMIPVPTCSAATSLM